MLTPERRRQLVTFLRSLGVDPTAAGGPGDSEEALAAIEEALSHSSAGLACNHERLEFLGDAVLRLAAAEFLHQHHPGLSVGRCSNLRAHLVSDRWLAELGERCGIAAVLHLGPTAAGDRAGQSTVLAESCEALIGGLYEAWGAAEGGLRPVHHWLTAHWQASATELLADPDRFNWKSALQEWTQAQGLGLPQYHGEERSRAHGDPRRFFCRVGLATSAIQTGEGSDGEPLGEGWGPSRRQAEQEAARAALARIRQEPGC